MTSMSRKTTEGDIMKAAKTYIYDLKGIMTYAWAIKARRGLTLSEALKDSWDSAKRARAMREKEDAWKAETAEREAAYKAEQAAKPAPKTYTIDELEALAYQAGEERACAGDHIRVHVNDWAKGRHNRTYIEVKVYSPGWRACKDIPFKVWIDNNNNGELHVENDRYDLIAA